MGKIRPASSLIIERLARFVWIAPRLGEDFLHYQSKMIIYKTNAISVWHTANTPSQADAFLHYDRIIFLALTSPAMARLRLRNLNLAVSDVLCPRDTAGYAEEV